MNRNSYYAYGEACCLLIYSEDLPSAVKRAYQEGYGFVVLYRLNPRSNRLYRRIIAWDCEVMGFEQAVEQSSDYHFLKALYDTGCRVFLKAPHSGSASLDIFPFRWFDSFVRLSATELSALLK